MNQYRMEISITRKRENDLEGEFEGEFNDGTYL